MSVPTVNDVLLGIATLLGDQAQEQFTTSVCLPWYQAAYREAYDIVSRWGLPVGARDAYFVIPANTTVLIPATAGITDMGEPMTVWERNQIQTFAITAVTNTTPVQVTTSTPHGLTEGAPCELVGIVGPIGVNGVEWRVHVVDSTNVQLNGSIAGGVYVSGGTLISGGEESSNPFFEMESVYYLPQTPPDTMLRYWKWQDDWFMFIGATVPVEVWIEYRSSGDPPSSGSVGWDNCLNFMQYRGASFVAPVYDMPETAAHCKMEALGQSGVPDGSGGMLRGFVYPMLKEKQKRPTRPLPFRPRRTGYTRGWW